MRTPSVVATGKLGFMGLQIPLTISLVKPNKAHLEADMAGSKMVLAYDGEQAWTVFFAIPASVGCFWIFWLMDRVGEHSENPFEGLSNDVPIKSMARGIERDIRQMLDETDLPPAVGPVEGTDILV